MLDSINASAAAASAAGNTWWITGLTRPDSISGQTRARSVAYKGALARELHARVWPLIESGRVRPVIHQVFPATEAAAAHALMETSQHVGKIMLTIRP